MSTALAFYALFKTLPFRTKKEVLNLIDRENQKKSALMNDIEEGLKEIKKIRRKEKQPLSLDALLEELKK